jgi:membrane-associated phospholipid phosphatase
VVWPRREIAARVSDVVGYAIVPALSAVAIFHDRSDHSATLVDVATLLNTALLTHGITEALKRSVARARPEAVLGYVDPNMTESNLSFPSGHTSMTFALVTASSWLAYKRNYRLAAVLAVVGGVSAAGTAYLRMAAAKHWLTDVATGAALGIFVGTFVPYLTFATLSPMAAARGAIVSLRW